MSTKVIAETITACSIQYFTLDQYLSLEKLIGESQKWFHKTDFPGHLHMALVAVKHLHQMLYNAEV